MGNAVTKISQDSILLCETCGYDLSGVPQAGKCPECGHDIAESAPNHRKMPAWEQSGNIPVQFAKTTIQAIFTPRRFYRTLITRASRTRSRRFAMLHWLIASVLFGWASCAHVNGVYYIDSPAINTILHHTYLAVPIFAAFTFLVFAIGTPVAARLTAWEARYRGLRLPLAVVKRSLDYHAADYLPVAVMSFVTIVGYGWLANRRWLDSAYDIKYLYLLCGEVIVGAAYLFNAYWIAMRNTMYANA